MTPGTPGTNKTLTPAGSVNDANNGNNYNVNLASVSTGTITPKQLTLNGVTAADKVYDGTASATLDFTAASLSGVVSGDTVDLNTGGGASGTFNDADAGSTKSVSITGASLSGQDSENYQMSGTKYNCRYF